MTSQRTCRIGCLLTWLLVAMAVVPSMACAQSNDSYADMLRYLTHSRIDGHAVQNASGAVSVNVAAGDLNAQANLRAVAVGNHASATIDARALQTHNVATAPDVATATIGGKAFSGTQGLLSINQASGAGNAELNAVTVALASQGIHEATDAQLLAGTSTSNGGQAPVSSQNGRERVRSVAVESTAMEGTTGVVQLNQVAGSANATANIFSLGVQGQP